MGACGSDGDSTNDDGAAAGADASAAADQNSASDSSDPADLGPEVTATSPEGRITLTAAATALSAPNPRIAVTWELIPLVDDCSFSVTRTNPEGALIGVDTFSECSGTAELTLGESFGLEFDELPGIHVIEMDYIIDEVSVEVNVPE